jgi:alanine dehydrogenase
MSVVAVPGPDPVMGVCVAQLSVGVLGRSRKENERRLAIHPRHLDRIEASLRGSVYLEQGYGERFGIPDEQLTGQVAGLRSRDGLLADCDVIMLPKPLPEDLQQLREGQVLWGWPHCVQNSGITQLAIDRRLTLIAFEAMHHWSGDGSFHLHVFHKNNELAGYCSVLHAMQLIGSTGEYGRPLRAAVISFGAAGRGAVTALQALGVAGIHILTHRDVTAVASPGPPARIVHFERDPADPARCQVLGGGGPVPMAA